MFCHTSYYFSFCAVVFFFVLYLLIIVFQATVDYGEITLYNTAVFINAFCINATGDAPVCSPQKFYQCGMKTRATYVRDNEAAKCNCPRECRRLIYEPTISHSQLAISAATYLKYGYETNSTVNVTVDDHCIVEVGQSSVNISSVCSFSKCYAQ